MKFQFFYLFIFPIVLYAQNFTYTYMDRNEKGELLEFEIDNQEKEKIIASAKNHFQIFIGTSMVPVAAPSTLKEITLLYHAEKAYQYFDREFHVKFPAKIALRYDIDRDFSPGRHFTAPSKKPKLNNACSIKASNDNRLEAEGILPWGLEIWFRPSGDEVLSGDRLLPLPSLDTNGVFLKNILGVADTWIVDNARTWALGLDPQFIDQSHYLLQLELLFIFGKAIPTLLSPFITTDNNEITIKLDTALIPEVIYHEFTHLALADFFPLNSTLAVAEAYANYFASVISNNESLIDQLGEVGKNIASIKYRPNKYKYQSDLEKNGDLSYRPFLFNLLLSMRHSIQKNRFDYLLFNSRRYIDLGSKESIRRELILSLEKSVDDLGLNSKSEARDLRLLIRNIGLANGL